MAYIEQLIQTIDARIEALTGQIRSLEDARSALIANGAAAGAVDQPRARLARAPSADRSARSRRRSSRRRQVLEPDTAERILAGGDGLSAAELARQAGADRDQVVKLLRDLEAARRARRTGEGRGTRWHAMTEEDWIRERAEELAARRSTG
jgi:hypothetical protein